MTNISGFVFGLAAAFQFFELVQGAIHLAFEGGLITQELIKGGKGG